MKTLSYLLQKEFRQIFRNKTILRMIIGLPIIQLTILPLTADYEIKNINISIVDHDRSPTSRSLISSISASGYFLINDFGNSFRSALREFEKDRSDLIIEIPYHFEQQLQRGERPNLFIAVNAINGVKASIGSAYLAQILSTFNIKLLIETAVKNRNPVSGGIEIISQNRFNSLQNYRFFMVPGILVILVTMIGAYMCALNIVKEKEMGSIEQINVTPIPKRLFILGKLIPFWIISMFVFSLGLFGIARLVYHIVPVGNILLIYGFLGLFLIATLGIGLIISNYSSTQQQAMSLAFFVMMIFILMSGLFTSINAMPVWAQWIAKSNPVTYFIEVVRMIVLKGSGWKDIQQHFLIIAAMAVLFNAWAIYTYRKTSA